MSDDINATTLQAIRQSLKLLAERDQRYEKERAEHVGDIRLMNSAIKALTDSNKEVNQNITKLVIQSERSETQITLLHELVNSRHTESKQQVDSLSDRVGQLERHNFEQAGERRAGEKQRKFWGDNWFKIVTLVLLSIPLVVALFKLVKG